MRILVLGVAALLFCGVSSAQQQRQPGIQSLLQQVAKQCEDIAVILADAKFSKWSKDRPQHSRHLNAENYEVVRKVMHTQCVSVHHVAILRAAKDATRNDDPDLQRQLDGEIERLMVVIEKTM